VGQRAWLTLVSTRSHRTCDAVRPGGRQTPRDAGASPALTAEGEGQGGSRPLVVEVVSG
jgi:hypothetical protein